MAKKNFEKGIDKLFSSTTGGSPPPAPSKGGYEEKKSSGGGHEVVSYNLRYSKDLQRRIKRFCIENDVDMKEVFIQGAILYLDARQ